MIEQSDIINNNNNKITKFEICVLRPTYLAKWKTGKETKRTHLKYNKWANECMTGGDRWQGHQKLTSTVKHRYIGWTEQRRFQNRT